MSTPVPASSPIVYPSSDGKRMAENTKQARWIVVLYDNLSALFADRPDVFVAADNLWYPVEGRDDVRVAPDVYLVFGRPKGDRPSYMQWQEGDIPLTVAFEIRSPSNDDKEMADKRAFYEEYGVDEFYDYDPDTNRLQIWIRSGSVLLRHRKIDGFVSPRLGIRFALTEPEMTVFHPDGRPFLPFEELEIERLEEQEGRLAAEARADQEQARADQAEARADQAEARAEQERTRAEQAETQTRQLARLAELGRKARRGQATADELQELDRLEQAHCPPPS
ncbi:MAG: Uma2 family endonuclease [Gemmataceae bacterium]